MDTHPLADLSANPPGPQTPAHSNRVRFGLKLPWPFQNAGIFVLHMTDPQWASFQDHITQAKGILDLVPGGPVVAAHIVCELS